MTEQSAREKGIPGRGMGKSGLKRRIIRIMTMQSVRLKGISGPGRKGLF